MSDNPNAMNMKTNYATKRVSRVPAKKVAKVKTAPKISRYGGGKLG